MLKVFLHAILYLNIVYADSNNQIDTDVVKAEHYVIWPNAVVPFYIEPEHFDNEQSLSIMTALSVVAFKTCLKFNPVLVRPTSTQHVLLFENPNGVRKCVFNTEGHTPDGPHRITLGYSCMKSPQIDTMLMRALGFPFEHNRASRDLFIDVQFENIDPGAIELFNKDPKLPPELRSLRYDVNSVSHFGEREFSKNGHRTIIFKDHDVHQNRNGLSELDLRKIEIVYGPECLKRERQEKIELCQNYPDVARRKREIDLSQIGPSLRVNREITPPPELTNKTTEALTALAKLGIENEARDIIAKIDQLSAAALRNARIKYCNITASDLRSSIADSKDSDPLGTLQQLDDYARDIVHHASEDSNSFCEAPDSTNQYLRARCNRPDSRCRDVYRSTQSVNMKHSTQHRPTYPYPTRHPPRPKIFEPISFRSGNSSDADDKVRTKREIGETWSSIKSKENVRNDDVDKERRSANVPMTSDDKLIANQSRLETTTNSASKGRRRFKDSPFSVYKKKKNEKEGMDVSDLSLENKQKRGSKKIKPMKRIHWKHAKEIRGNRRVSSNTEARKVRSKRDSAAVGKSLKPENDEEDVGKKEKGSVNPFRISDGKSDHGITEGSAVTTAINRNQRRRFEDNPFSVYKKKKNEKEGMDVSDLSLENKQKRGSKKMKPMTKIHWKHAKEIRGNRRVSSNTGASKVRRKRDSAAVGRSIKPENNKGNIGKKENESVNPLRTSYAADHGIKEGSAVTAAINRNQRRRFKDNPFSVYKRKKNLEDAGVSSDISLETTPNKRFKKFNPIKETSLTQKKEIGDFKRRSNTEVGKSRNKREVTMQKISTEPKRNEENENIKAKLADVVQKLDGVPSTAERDTLKKTRGHNPSVFEGRRRFRDSPFSVHKLNKNEKKSMYASDLSLEGKFSKPKRLKKNRDNTEVSGRRNKREAIPTRSSLEQKTNGENNENRESNMEGIPLNEVLLEAVEDEVNKTIMGRRRFRDTPFRIHKGMKNKREEYASDLSLENEEERVFKKMKPVTKMSQKNKEIRGSDRFEEIRQARERDGMKSRKTVPRTVVLSKGNEEFYADRRWPDGVVRYTIKYIPKYDLDDVRYRLEEVNKILKEKTCVRLVEITEDEKSLFEDYLVLDNSPDYVTGRVGGKQNFGVVELFEGGQHRQHSAMVVMSMLGFYFEPSRHDRDRYIRVHPRHIRPDKLHHFEKLRPEATLPLPYDYQSATHPAWQFWRHFGKSGISSLATYKDQDPDGSIMKSLGHNTNLLSELDIVKINSVYGVGCFQ